MFRALTAHHQERTKIVITQPLALVTPCLLQRLTMVESKLSQLITILVSPDDER
jgi:hypothetical protein